MLTLKIAAGVLVGLAGLKTAIRPRSEVERRLLTTPYDRVGVILTTLWLVLWIWFW